ncbi:hypothetical protein ACFQDF_24630 [Ectobacillus funiculus]|uniref:Uncharacterized protein n=1 Tax=Ectobacillus funiculus TaxID=137993 RepID=A0ABV5W974_9BACI
MDVKNNMYGEKDREQIQGGMKGMIKVIWRKEKTKIHRERE